IDCGSDSVTPPVEADTLTWFDVPVSDVTPALSRVISPPSDTEPPPDIPVPAVTVIALSSRASFGIPEKFAPSNVGDAPSLMSCGSDNVTVPVEADTEI